MIHLDLQAKTVHHMQQSSQEKTKMIRSLQPQPLADTASRIALTKTHTTNKNKRTVKLILKKNGWFTASEKATFERLPNILFEQLQLIPVSFVNNGKVSDTYALIDPGSQFNFMLDQIADFLEILSSETANMSLQYININHEMPVAKVDNTFNLAPYKQTVQTFPIRNVYKTPFLNIPPAEGNGCRPHGTQTRLGWTIAGEYHQTIAPTRFDKVRNRQTSGFVFHVTRKSNESVEQPLDYLVQQFWKIEETGQKTKEKEFYTENNLAAIRILENTIHHTGERYEIGLPWKNEIQLQNNYYIARNQLKSLDRRLAKNNDLRNFYEATLVNDLKKKHVRPVEMKRIKPSRIWYLPHHPVQNPNKPTKIRRVANDASLFKGQSLNNNLLTGPDLLANLTGILLRFRKHSIGLLVDFEGLFMQVSIREEDRPALRFLGSYNGKVHQYEYTRLIFGATCSPFCAIYALQNALWTTRTRFLWLMMQF